jgi:hypothetical protein
VSPKEANSKFHQYKDPHKLPRYKSHTKENTNSESKGRNKILIFEKAATERQIIPSASVLSQYIGQHMAIYPRQLKKS